MTVFLFVALNLSQVLSENLEYNRRNNGWPYPLVEEKARQRVGSSPAVEVCDFVGSCWVQRTCNLVLAHSQLLCHQLFGLL